MSRIQSAIHRAVITKGDGILECKKYLCRILEDLAPDCVTERQWIESLYTEELGRILAKAAQVTFLEKPQYLREADAYLLNQTGLMEQRRKEFLEMFKEILVGHVVEVKKYRDYKPALMVLKKQYGKSLSRELIQIFVEENRLFSRFSMTLEDVISDLDNLQI